MNGMLGLIKRSANIYLTVLIAACSFGYTTAQCDSNCAVSCDGANPCTSCFDGFYVDSIGNCGQCSDPGCKTCSGPGTTDCTMCYDGSYIGSGGLCTSCDASCAMCSSATNCTQCANSGKGPNLNPSDGTCSDCGGNCTICDKTGAGKCDPGGCYIKWALDTTTGTCQPCKGAKCAGCVVPDTCPTCTDGTGLDGTGTMPQAGCKPCEVLHAKQCTASYKTFVICDDDYYPNTTANTCDPICATVGKDEWNGQTGTCGSTLATPAKMVIIHHTRSGPCFNYTTCLTVWKSIQTGHMMPKSADNPGGGQCDIAYHYGIGEDGEVYAGRPPTTCGAATSGYLNGKNGATYNCVAIAIAFIGDFTQRAPNTKAQAALYRFLSTSATNQYGEGCTDSAHENLDPNWMLYPHTDVQCTTCPGGKFVETLYTMFGPTQSNSVYKNRYVKRNPPITCSSRSVKHPVK